MKIGDEITVNIMNLDDFGRGVAHYQGYTIFVSNALENETVKIKITNVKSKLLEAEVINIISKSLKRIEPDCPYFNQCGGCSLRHLNYEDTLKYKENKIKHAIQKFANLEPNIVDNIVSINNMNYRNKVEFKINNGIGFYKKKSNKVVVIESCKLVDNKINNIIKLIHYPNELNSLTIRASKYTNDLMVIATGNIHEDDLKRMKKDATSIYLNKENIYGNSIIYEKLGDFVYTISPTSFFQVNTDMALKLYNGIKEKLEPNKQDNVLDLYCGTGTIGIFIAKEVNKVIGIELNEEAIKDAKENANINEISNITFKMGSVSKAIKNIDFKANKIIVDPPRSGLDIDTIEYLNESNAEKIIYVSCDPITLSRDIHLLKKYKVLSITPYDMFPYSYHCESITVLERR